MGPLDLTHHWSPLLDLLDRGFIFFFFFKILREQERESAQVGEGLREKQVPAKEGS